MTTPEHTLIGIHVAFALGAYRKYGWTVVALSAVASNLPDLDGLPMIIDMARFEHGHRVWGHNLFSILLTSLLLAALQYRFHFVEAIAARTRKYLPEQPASEHQSRQLSFVVIFLAAVVAQMAHLPCDMVVSGGSGLADWHIKPFWPVSEVGYVYPLIPWGDVGPTLIMMSGVLLMAKFPRQLQQKSCLTLLALLAYLLVRGYSRGTLYW